MVKIQDVQMIIETKSLMFKEPNDNLATKFLAEFGINSTGIYAHDPNQVASLINANIKQISTILFNKANEKVHLFVDYNISQLVKELGPESIKLLQNSVKEVHKSISELCRFIKVNNKDPITIFNKIGVTYEHGNLPPACDGLIPFSALTSNNNIVIKNFVSKFFDELNINCTKLDVTSPLHITNFVKENLQQISSAILANTQSINSLITATNDKEIQKTFGSEAIRLLVDRHNEMKKSVSELCNFIKVNEQDAEEVFDLLGISYNHHNLPSECDDLF